MMKTKFLQEFSNDPHDSKLDGKELFALPWQSLTLPQLHPFLEKNSSFVGRILSFSSSFSSKSSSIWSKSFCVKAMFLLNHGVTLYVNNENKSTNRKGWPRNIQGEILLTYH